MRLLLEAKAELHAVDKDGATAFHYTCVNNHPDCAEALVRAGCNTKLRSESGKTGRDVAQEQGHAAVLERLKELKKTEANRKKKEQKRRKKERERRAAMEAAAAEPEPELGPEPEPEREPEPEPEALSLSPSRTCH